MNLSQRLSNSFYEIVTAINEPHKVFLVRHRASGRFFVKKILDIYSADVYKDLQAHPIAGIPRIIDSWDEDGRLIIIEEFISGITLRDKIEMTSDFSSSDDGYEQEAAGFTEDIETITSDTLEHPDSIDILTTDRIGQYMIGLCEILERMHSHNPPLIHRDLKPSNIIITNCDNVILLDFNAARFYTGESGKESDTCLLGTKGYAAPEQYGFGESSPQTDLYSVGKIMKECIAALPAEKKSGSKSQVNGQISTKSRIDSQHIFDKIIKKCTQIDPSKRYASASALKAALLASLGQSSCPDITGTVVNPYLPPGFRTFNPWKMLIAAAVYFFVFQLSFTLTVQNSSGAELWFERFIVLFLALMNIVIGSNYLGIHRHIPFHDSSSRWLRITGVVFTMVVSTLIVFMILIFIVGAFFH